MLDAGQERPPASSLKIEPVAKTVLGPRPMGAALSPDGKTLYVSMRPRRIGRRHRRRHPHRSPAHRRRRRPPLGHRVSPDGKKLFTANGPSNDVSIVDAATGVVEKRIKVGGLPWGLLLAPASR